MNNQNKKEQIYTEWVERVYDYLVKTGLAIDKCSSVMQSKPVLNKQPDVLFLEFCPTEDCNYVRVDKKRFFFGSPFFQTDRNEWRVWSKLYSAFENANYLAPLTDEHYMYMNAVYFGSDDIARLKEEIKSKNNDLTYNDIVNQCLAFTKELIHQIIQPKCIVCFSVKDCYEPLKNHFNFIREERLVCQGDKIVSQGEKDFSQGEKKKNEKHYIFKAEWDTIPVFGITHPSAAISNADWEKITLILKKEMKNLDI